MFVLVLLFSCSLLRFAFADTTDYCNAIPFEFCDADFLCIWDGSSLCEHDLNAEVFTSPNNCRDVNGLAKTGCYSTTYNFYDAVLGSTYPIYLEFSDIKVIDASNPLSMIDLCSIDYTAAYEINDNSNYCPTATPQSEGCALKNFGYSPSTGCFGFCWVNPAIPGVPGPCQSEPCPPGKSGTYCCGTIVSSYCSSYCSVNGSSSTCCGSPPTYATTTSGACWNYVAVKNNFESDQVLIQTCQTSGGTNLTACAMCSSYYKCCSQYKNVTGNALVCDAFCTEKSSDADCQKRKKCIESLGHVPTDAELAKCGTSMVRLSSFTVAVLLGVMAFFFLS